ncbi:hypothetical protein F7725_028210 [Dissostichus mawsoni]|uniref:Uncharacterized protein n=1 Tax=Dissostichus mawsoni TaxID=36200 RepID=A0A7J5XF38_DISMA|nr:hypothetical protein F7725_028210 [Dissostichus mawsoni]
MYPDVSPNCDTCQTAEASLIHMYWSCPSLSMYWTEIFQTLSQRDPTLPLLVTRSGYYPESYSSSVISSCLLNRIFTA